MHTVRQLVVVATATMTVMVAAFTAGAETYV